MAVGCITFHAIERLQQRRNCEHLLRHLNKVRKWNLPEDSDTVHKGFRYITRGGVLVTVIPDRKTIKTYQERKVKENETNQ